MRKGFTLVELLVVIAIMGMFLAMMIPAVQMSRETARRFTCMDNLHRIGLGMQQYHAVQWSFPPGVVDEQDPIRSLPQGKHLGWTVHLLPYLDHGVIYDHVDDDSVYSEANARVRSITVPELQCPSSSGAIESEAVPSCYAACCGGQEGPITSSLDGTFFLNSAVSDDDIPDGLGCTLLVSEKLIEQDDLGWMSGTRATLRNTSHAPDPRQYKSPADRVPYYQPIPKGSPSPWDPKFELFEQQNQSTIEIPPESESEQEQADESGEASSQPERDPLYVGGFASEHIDLVEALMADGSVRTISVMVDPEVFRRLGSRNDGELLDPATF
ncbi:MAG: DUF1559 domain-containing protein [Planctomycetota bacterium]|nr:MAG: DUF1559 domain-containing protein [Planctomycetota bacterium]